MAQSTFHFGFGMLCATVFTLKPVLRAWLETSSGGRQSPAAVAEPPTPVISPAIARWCLWSYAIGALAVVPAIARRLIGIDPTRPFWNIFLFYPQIDRLPLPSIILGELLMGTILAAQYATILLAIYLHRPHRQSGQPGQHLLPMPVDSNTPSPFMNSKIRPTSLWAFSILPTK